MLVYNPSFSEMVVILGYTSPSTFPDKNAYPAVERNILANNVSCFCPTYDICIKFNLTLASSVYSDRIEIRTEMAKLATMKLITMTYVEWRIYICTR